MSKWDFARDIAYVMTLFVVVLIIGVQLYKLCERDAFIEKCSRQGERDKCELLYERFRD